jgi:hypothetical protein
MPGDDWYSPHLIEVTIRARSNRIKRMRAAAESEQRELTDDEQHQIGQLEAALLVDEARQRGEAPIPDQSIGEELHRSGTSKPEPEQQVSMSERLRQDRRRQQQQQRERQR